MVAWDILGPFWSGLPCRIKLYCFDGLLNISYRIWK